MNSRIKEKLKRAKDLEIMIQNLQGECGGFMVWKDRGWGECFLSKDNDLSGKYRSWAGKLKDELKAKLEEGLESLLKLKPPSTLTQEQENFIKEKVSTYGYGTPGGFMRSRTMHCGNIKCGDSNVQHGDVCKTCGAELI